MHLNWSSLTALYKNQCISNSVSLSSQDRWCSSPAVAHNESVYDPLFTLRHPPQMCFVFCSCLSLQYFIVEDYKVIAAPNKLLSSILNTWLNSEDRGRISCKFGPGCSKRSNWDLIESYWHSTNYRHSPLDVILLVYNSLKQNSEFILFNHCYAS